jgi:hypothetical protein
LHRHPTSVSSREKFVSASKTTTFSLKQTPLPPLGSLLPFSSRRHTCPAITLRPNSKQIKKASAGKAEAFLVGSARLEAKSELALQLTRLVSFAVDRSQIESGYVGPVWNRVVRPGGPPKHDRIPAAEQENCKLPFRLLSGLRGLQTCLQRDFHKKSVWETANTPEPGRQHDRDEVEIMRGGPKPHS